ncbi:GNAT family N-acetyltransferase [Trueperella sp. LYQ143]|uniref:GNAT family N-acetyltransferase n=1 Tax=unclassified Trueperella TaxID=2630174 RepID=UPI003982E372
MDGRVHNPERFFRTPDDTPHEVAAQPASKQVYDEVSGQLVRVPFLWWAYLASFDADNFGVDAWPPGVWKQELLAQDRSYLAVIRDDGPLHPRPSLVALGGISHGPEAEILTIAVARAQRSRGIGSALLADLLAVAQSHEAEAVFLEVRARDEKAQRMYQRAGFETVGRRPRYYHDDDALIMRYELSRSH